MEKEADIDAVRFEVALFIRQVYPMLPADVSCPQIRASHPNEDESLEQLLKLTDQPKQRSKAITLVQNHLDKDIKVLTKAIEDIKTEMLEIMAENKIQIKIP